MKRKLVLLAALIALLLIPAQAESALMTFPYDQTAMELHMDGAPLELNFDGEIYALDSCEGRFNSALPLYGGNCGSVIEMDVPAEQFSVEDDGAALLLGSVVFDVPYKAELAVYDGNRISGEYTLTGRIDLTDVYTEDIFLPRGADGKPVLVDRVYLLSYERGGETVRSAMPLYIGYDQFDARHADSAAVSATPEPARTVIFDDLRYGENALALHMADEENFIVFDGEKYSLNDDCGSFAEAFPVYGGKTRALYEITVPADRFSVDGDGSELLLGTLSINAPTRAQLTVCCGNRRSGEYFVGETVALSDVYTEDIFLPRDADGKPVVLDRIYLYSYEVSGETRRFALSLYIDYENYAAGHLPVGDGQASEAVSAFATEAPATAAPTEAPATAAPTDAPAETESFSDESESVNTSVIVVLLSIVSMALILISRARNRKAKDAKENQPAAPPTSDETLSRGQELLGRIREEGGRMPDDELNGRIDRLNAVCTQMLAAAEEEPAKAAQLRKFLNYYLPTAQKMVSVLRTVRERGVSSAEVEKARVSTLRGLDLILSACQKQLDNLYKGELLDASADIDVLEQMLARDGFLESDFEKLRKGRE